ncbi:lipase maturation factor 1-like [Ylistrum balloti]|uniref:lipase maturation factor 1-like n=1 Tax=Ylistrum balloti TaxID=509963 RepID=UPI002905CF09|nr:lipase maturation factor 1-like [Ylistrum balloti]
MAGENAVSATETVRRRNVCETGSEKQNISDKNVDTNSTEGGKTPLDMRNCKIEHGTYWLTRILLLRFLGFIYFVAFFVALNQNKQLLGKKGLIPATNFLKKVEAASGGINLNSFSYVPSVVWLVDYHSNLDSFLDYIAYLGIGLSLFLIINGGANWFIMLSLWILYHSIVNIGTTWYGFGWESQLLETGFLATFLCPVWNLSSVPRDTPTSKIIIWAYRWLIFRIMIGAGLIKIRGDQCWRDLTCMNYHYQTQPVPNPLSYYLHQTPEAFHRFETMTNHFVELIAPLFLLLTRRMVILGGCIQALFQVVLITSGNLSFLNWLTIVPSLACFDDTSIAWMFSDRRNSAKWKVKTIQQMTKDGRHQSSPGSYIRKLFNLSVGVLIAYLSIPVVQNLVSPRQAMNTSFEPLRIVNTYGAFGSVTKERTEIILQGTYDNPYDKKAVWEEYEFHCKPGNVTQRPCLISPYHYRLDWLMWFAAFQSYERNPWLVHLCVKLMVNDEDTSSLIAHNPFQGRDPPEYIRMEHYKYTFTKIGSKDAKNGKWWKRKYIDSYLNPISLKSVKEYMKQMDYKMPVKKAKRKLKSQF